MAFTRINMAEKVWYIIMAIRDLHENNHISITLYSSVYLSCLFHESWTIIRELAGRVLFINFFLRVTPCDRGAEGLGLFRIFIKGKQRWRRRHQRNGTCAATARRSVRRVRCLNDHMHRVLADINISF